MTTTETTGWDDWLRRHFPYLLGFGVLANASGLFVTIMEPDAALYATIARKMAESGDYLQLFARGTDWLDKPHFPFWVTALSFRLFGVSEVAYKLPALGFFALALVYTWRYARLLYSPPVARLAVLLLLTAQHVIMSNGDVRAEPYLMGLLIAAIYHLVRATPAPDGWHIVPGAGFAACAVMTKGPFILIPIAAALVAHWAGQRDWRQLLRPRWYLALLLVAVFITPELYALWVQFDARPEKVVFGRTNVSGLRFFFWDSQFGRFLNSGPIRGRGDPSFFLHTLLWAFLPWSLLLYAALFSRLRRLGRERDLELYSLGAAVPMFVVFSLSRFQLPHYTNILFPFFAVIAAAWLIELRPGRSERALSIAQSVIAALMVLAPVMALFAFDPSTATLPSVVFVLLCALTSWWLRGREVKTAIARSFVVACAANILLNVAFYPPVFRYQAGTEAARLLNTLPPRRTAMYVFNSFAFELYSHRPIERFDLEALRRAAESGPVYLFVPEDRLQELSGEGFAVRIVQAFDQFPIAQLKPRFLYEPTRPATLKRWVLAEVR